MAKAIMRNDGSTMLLVEMGVGAGRANNLDDVVLVQHLLNLWIDHPTSAVDRQSMGAANSKLLTVDGLFGPKTGARIKQFQSISSTGIGIVVDD